MLRGTTNYIYRSSDLLGRGASCNVYKGVHKKTGKERALKIFNVSLPAQLNEALKREVEALKSLSHPNVVTFFSLETEVFSGNNFKVLVMELCTGGSLLTILQEPRYAVGLTEDEFLLFLDHVVRGLKHLRLNGFVHRDIKPGNILRSIGEDGKSVYKLSDFGSAKRLEIDDEQFVSMYGTEEYLHPDIFEKAFIDRSAPKHFTLSVDLWSMGATLYHALTGSVPFRPYGGRRDKETMFEMIGQKDTGVISGVQETSGGEITWSKNLPDTCSVSQSLKTVVRNMCAGMMERDPNRMWTFDTFFRETELLFAKERVFLFSTIDCSSTVIYLQPNDTPFDLKRQIQRLMKIEPDKQVLFWNEKPLEEHMELTEETQIDDFPKTDSSRPLVLFGTCSMEECPLPPSVRAEYPQFVDSGGGFEADFRIAKQSLDVLCGVQKIIEDYRLSQEFLCNGAAAFRSHIMSRIGRLEEKVQRELSVSRQMYKSMEHSLGLLKATSKEETSDRQSYDFGDGDSKGVKICDNVQHLVDGFTKVLEEFEDTQLWCRMTQAELDISISPEKALEMTFGFRLMCRRDCECITSTKWQIGELEKLTRKFDERRRQNRIAYHEEQLHSFDKRHLEEVCGKSSLLLNDHCLPAIEKVFCAFKSWHRAFRPKKLELEDQFIRTRERIKILEDIQTKYHMIQTNLMSKYLKAAPRTVDSCQTSSPVDHKRKRRQEMVKALESSLMDSLNDPLSLREEMNSLQQSLNSMAETLTITDEPERLCFEEVLK